MQPAVPRTCALFPGSLQHACIFKCQARPGTMLSLLLYQFTSQPPHKACPSEVLQNLATKRGCPVILQTDVCGHFQSLDMMYLVVQQGGCPEVEWLNNTASQPLPLEATRALVTPRMGGSPVAALTDISDLRDCPPWATGTDPVRAERSCSLHSPCHVTCNCTLMQIPKALLRVTVLMSGWC